MIIECSACHAKFRLDESRIKGRGVRVRCRKCGGYIVVLRPAGEEEPPAPPRSDFLDLRSVIGESLAPGTPPAPASTAAEIPEPSPVVRAAGPPEPAEDVLSRREADRPEATAESAPRGEEAPSAPAHFEAAPAEGPGREGEKDEVDLAFERFLSSAPGGPAESPAEPLPPPAPPQGEMLEFAPEEKIELPVEGTDARAPAAPWDVSAPPPEAAPGASEAPSAPEFLLSDADTLGFLRDESRKTADRPGAPEIPPGLDAVPLLSLEDTLRPAVPGDAEPPPAVLPPQPPPRAEEAARAVEAAEPRATVPPPESHPAHGAVEPRRVERPPEEHAPRRAPAARPVYARPGVIALVLIFLGLAGGGGYLGFTPGGQEQLRRFVPSIESLLGRRGAPAPGPAYDVRNLIGYLETGAGGRKMFVIKGQVANVSPSKKTGIRIKASLLDDKDLSVADRTVYAGNVMTGDALRQADRPKIEAALSNRFGDKLVNVDVPPGKAIPFMVVFDNPPEGVSAYRLEAIDGE